MISLIGRNYLGWGDLECFLNLEYIGTELPLGWDDLECFLNLKYIGYENLKKINWWIVITKYTMTNLKEKNLRCSFFMAKIIRTCENRTELPQVTLCKFIIYNTHKTIQTQLL